MKKVFLWLLIILMIAVFSLAGCKKTAAAETTTAAAETTAAATTAAAAETTTAAAAEEVVVPVKIKFFTGKVETVDLVDKMIDEFDALNPGIKVSQEFQKDASSVIKIKFAAGDIPDIIAAAISQDYIDQGLFLDLSDETQWWSRIQPSIKERCTDVKTGKQYKFASNMTMAGIFYNKNIFSELGLKEATTWEQFVSNLEAIKANKPDVVPMFLAGKDSWTLGHLMEFMADGVIKQTLGAVEAQRAFLANDDSKLQYGVVGGPIEAFAARLLELQEKELINSDAVTATYDNQITEFANGKVGLISQGMWALANILASNPDLTAKDIGFCPFPPIVEGTSPTILNAEDSVYAIAAASKHPEEAKAFMDFMFSVENLKKYSEFLKSPSAFVDVDADWGILKDEVTNALQNGVNIGFSNERPSGFSGDDIGRMVQDLLAGTYSSSTEFAKAYKDGWDKAWNATQVSKNSK